MSDQAEDRTARRELVVQTIALVFGLTAAVALPIVQRNASDPDWWRLQKMRAAKTVERFYARLGWKLAGASYRIAEQARVDYEQERWGEGW
jgi:hypothetical protein